MNEQEVKDNEEYNKLTSLAKELYNMIKNSDSRLKHEDIMDILYGYVNMKVFKKDNRDDVE